jgi:hypothetical protein
MLWVWGSQQQKGPLFGPINLLPINIGLLFCLLMSTYYLPINIGLLILEKFDTLGPSPYYPTCTSATRLSVFRSWTLFNVGAWLSLVERSVRDREVGGSNPLAPTN